MQATYVPLVHTTLPFSGSNALSWCWCFLSSDNFEKASAVSRTLCVSIKAELRRIAFVAPYKTHSLTHTQTPNDEYYNLSNPLRMSGIVCLLQCPMGRVGLHCPGLFTLHVCDRLFSLMFCYRVCISAQGLLSHRWEKPFPTQRGCTTRDWDQYFSVLLR